jgi:hypothetical protein
LNQHLSIKSIESRKVGNWYSYTYLLLNREKTAGLWSVYEKKTENVEVYIVRDDQAGICEVCWYERDDRQKVVQTG